MRLLGLEDEPANANARNRPDGLLDAGQVPIEKLVEEREAEILGEVGDLGHPGRQECAERGSVAEGLHRQDVVGPRNVETNVLSERSQLQQRPVVVRIVEVREKPAPLWLGGEGGDGRPQVLVIGLETNECDASGLE